MNQYFAQINKQNVVTDVRIVSQEFLEANPERYTGTWVETFLNTPGKQYAGLGFIYNEETEDFEPPSTPEPVEP